MPPHCLYEGFYFLVFRWKQIVPCLGLISPAYPQKVDHDKNLTTSLAICCGIPQYFHMFHVSHYVRLSRVQYAYLLIPSPSSWPQNDSSLGIWFELLCQRDWVWYSSQLLHGIAIPWRNPSTRERKEKYIIDRCLMQGQRQETQMEDGNVQQTLFPKASTMADNKTWAHSKKPISNMNESSSENIPNT